MKKREFKVLNNRMHFRCPHCGASRMITIPPGFRRKGVRCHSCSTIVQCVLNRRSMARELQTGKVTVVTSDREVDVFLHDLSSYGVGFLLPPGSLQSHHLSIGTKVRFKCNWNSRLLGSNYFEIKNIRGQRVGAQKCR